MFSQFDGGKDSFPLDWVFSAFIAIGLIRDNEGVVIENYPTSLIGEIRFDLYNKLILGIILLPLLVRFSLIYRTWIFQIVHVVSPLSGQTGLPFWAGARGSGISLGLPFPWAWRVGLRAYFLNPISSPPSPWVRRACARAISFLESGATFTCLLRVGLVRALSPSYVLG